MIDDGKTILKLTKGDYIGSMQRLYKDEPAVCTFSYDAPVSLFAMKKVNILRFLEKNPGILMKSVNDI